MGGGDWEVPQVYPGTGRCCRLLWLMELVSGAGPLLAGGLPLCVASSALLTPPFSHRGPVGQG